MSAEKHNFLTADERQLAMCVIARADMAIVHNQVAYQATGGTQTEWTHLEMYLFRHIGISQPVIDNLSAIDIYTECVITMFINGDNQSSTYHAIRAAIKYNRSIGGMRSEEGKKVMYEAWRDRAS